MSRMPRVASSLVGFVLLAVVLPGRAGALQVSYSETFSSDSVDGGGFSFSLSPFDPSLGTLTRVDVAEGFSTVGTGLAQNSSSVWPALGWIEQHYSLIGDDEQADATVATVYLPAGPSSARFSANYQGGGEALLITDVVGGSFDMPGSIYHFTGSNFNYTMNYSAFTPDHLDWGLTITPYTDTVTGTLQITYTFDPFADPPSASVPEPSTAAGAGLAALVGLGYRWKRRRTDG